MRVSSDRLRAGFRTFISLFVCLPKCTDKVLDCTASKLEHPSMKYLQYHGLAWNVHIASNNGTGQKKVKKFGIIPGVPYILYRYMRLVR